MITTTVETPIGPVGVGATGIGLAVVRFPTADGAAAAMPSTGEPEDAARRHLDAAVRQLSEYFDGQRTRFDLDVDWGGVAGLRLLVLRALFDEVPFGRTTTYGELARRAGRPETSQAVGQAMGSNPVPIVVPCHRVLAADGLGGFGGGRRLKEWLLAWEGSLTPSLELNL